MLKANIIYQMFYPFYVEKKQKINATIAENYEETLGINSREQLANAEKIIRQRKIKN